MKKVFGILGAIFIIGFIGNLLPKNETSNSNSRSWAQIYGAKKLKECILYMTAAQLPISLIGRSDIMADYKSGAAWYQRQLFTLSERERSSANSENIENPANFTTKEVLAKALKCREGVRDSE